MNIRLIAACATLAIAAMSCNEDTKGSHTTSDADTAALVNDPNNTLNANPVNDTIVADTVNVAH
jgi:hypothetical protein